MECFTEPYRSVEVAAPEIGVLAELLVKEGQHVKKGETLAQLDDSVLQLSLEVARASKLASGSLQAARGELATREQQLESYRQLRRNENATDRELQRAVNAVEIARAKVQIVQDEMEVRRLEYERAKAQLERRTIRAPLDGVVVEVKKQPGEFVSPTDPVILSVIELSRLRAIFSVPRHLTTNLTAGASVPLTIGDDGRAITGTIEFISPKADPQSDTVPIKIGINNESHHLPCGVICRWNGTQSSEQPVVEPASQRRISRQPQTLQPLVGSQR
jgi:RND family efflux transporter MFP subunit